MRHALAAAILLSLALPATAQSSNWTFQYLNGVSTAATTDDRGRPSATFTCRPPTGDLIITEYTLGRRRADRAEVRVGTMSITVPARIERQGRDRMLVIPLPQAPPILAAALDPQAAVTITADGRNRTLPEGAGAKLREVAYACWHQEP